MYWLFWDGFVCVCGVCVCVCVCVYTGKEIGNPVCPNLFVWENSAVFKKHSPGLQAHFHRESTWALFVCFLVLFSCFLFCFVFLFSFIFYISIGPHCAAWGLLVPQLGFGLDPQDGNIDSRRLKHREFPDPGNINQHVHSWRYPYQHQDLAPHNCLQVPVLNTSNQTTIKRATEAHSSVDRLPKVILTS